MQRASETMIPPLILKVITELKIDTNHSSNSTDNGNNSIGYNCCNNNNSDKNDNEKSINNNIDSNINNICNIDSDGGRRDQRREQNT